MLKLKTFLHTKPVFLYLLPVFFVLHGFTDNFPLVPVRDALILNAKYLAASLLFSLLFWLLYRNFYKANLVAFFIMAYNFFYGKGLDFLKTHFANTLIVQYTFILPFTVITFLLLAIFLKKTKKELTGIGKYLNYLFLLLILIDSANLLFKFTVRKKSLVYTLPTKLINCDTCSRPDIYLILADEYAGKTALKDKFSFDNSDFENRLKSRGFYVVNNSKSNYNRTQYSMASTLNMTYLENLTSTGINNIDIFQCLDIIEENNVAKFFKKNGYEIYNYSLFDLADKPKPVIPTFIPSRESLITAQTFTKRANKNLWFNFSSKRKIQDILDQNLNNNLKIDSLTRKIVCHKNTIPKFVYTHLVMPHYSYYFDSSGKKTNYENLTDGNEFNKEAYIEYLVYTNKKLLELIDHIKRISAKPPLIILMSDHGFRQFADNEKVDPRYHFMNLNSVYIPDGNYTGFYDGMSNVNQFRLILNSQFGQKLPLLKDSTSFIWY